MSVVRRQQGAILRQRFELTDVDANRFSFDLLATPREFVKLSPSHLLRRVHRRGLFDLTAKGSQRSFDFFFAEALRALRLCVRLTCRLTYALTRHIPSISRIAQTN